MRRNTFNRSVSEEQEIHLSVISVLCGGPIEVSVGKIRPPQAVGNRIIFIPERALHTASPSGVLGKVI